MKYIFVAGAPGSKWSGVVKNIYFSPSVNRSDYREDWTYYKGDQLMHLGAYFDPGMECDLPENLDSLSRQKLEEIFNAPFADDVGVKIIKSHVFSEHIPFLRATFPEVPIVLVYRSDDACLGWWVKAGHFNITYPNYQEYYKDFENVAMLIQRQNAGIRTAMDLNVQQVHDNSELATVLGLERPINYKQNYAEHDIEVRVLL